MAIDTSSTSLIYKISMVVSERASLLQQTAVNSILAEVRRLQSQGQKPVSLMRGEPDFLTPPHIIEAAAAAMRNGRTTYPDNRGEPMLRQAISEKLERDNGLRYDPDSEILVTTGATFGIYAALAAIVNEGDEVLVPDPIYDAYQSPIRLAGGRPSPVRATIARGRFQLDVVALEAAYTPSSKVLLLNTPWNPTGAVLREPELKGIGDFVERHNLVLISDEIYEAITYAPHHHVSPASLSEALRARTVLVNSLSKTYAMTGWRVGYCAAPKQIIAAMFLVLQQSSRGPATFVQDASAAALTGPQDCVAEMLAEYGRRRSLVIRAPGWHPRYPSSAARGRLFCDGRCPRCWNLFERPAPPAARGERCSCSAWFGLWTRRGRNLTGFLC